MSSEKKPQGFAVLKKKNPAAHKAVSSRGGSATGRKGYALLTPEERKANASRASKARWDRVKAERQVNEAESQRQGNRDTGAGEAHQEG